MFGNLTFVYRLRILDFLSFAGINFSKFGFQTLLLLQVTKKEFVAHYLGQKCQPLKSHDFQFNLTVSWWIIMTFGQNVPWLSMQKKRCTAFLIFQVLLLLSTLMWWRSANIQFANFNIDFLINQSEYRESLTPFCSLSATDWHCAVCLVVLASRKADTVTQFNK